MYSEVLISNQRKNHRKWNLIEKQKKEIIQSSQSKIMMALETNLIMSPSTKKMLIKCHSSHSEYFYKYHRLDVIG